MNRRPLEQSWGRRARRWLALGASSAALGSLAVLVTQCGGLYGSAEQMEPPLPPGTDARPDGAATDGGVACVDGWRVSHPRVAFGPQLLPIAHTFDPTTRRLYVGARATTGSYFAVVDACTGRLVQGPSDPTISGQAMLELKDGVFHGDKLFVRGRSRTAPMGGYAIYDRATSTFGDLVSLAQPSPNADGGVWGLIPTPKGDVLLAGAELYGPMFVALANPGAQCFLSPIAALGGKGFPRAMTFDGTDGFVTVDALGGESAVLRFSLDGCTPTSCATCAAEVLPPIALADAGAAGPNSLAAKVVNRRLVVGGFMTATKQAFLAQYPLYGGSQAWGTPWTYHASEEQDAVLDIDSDGSYVYAAVLKNWNLTDTNGATAEIHKLGFEISAGTKAADVFAVPALSVPMRVSLDGDGIIVTGLDANTSNDGASLRCVLGDTTCPRVR